MKKKRLICITDVALIPVFILSAGSGVGLRLAGHGTVHEVWHCWAVFHTIVSLPFLLLAVSHVKSHWEWYLSAFWRREEGRRRATLFLTFVFLSVALTGILLLGVEGAHSSLGMWHYRIGLLTIVFSAWHIFRRISVLRKMLSGKRF